MFFPNTSEGIGREQYRDTDGILINASQTGPVYNTEHGLCTKPREAETTVEIVEEDSEYSRSRGSSFMYMFKSFEEFVDLNCARFAMLEGDDMSGEGPALDQYVSVQLTTGTWKYMYVPTRVRLMKTWGMEP